MRVKYKGKFREALLDYISEQPWIFELDACGMSFFELPIAMQFGVVEDLGLTHGVEMGVMKSSGEFMVVFSGGLGIVIDSCRTIEEARKGCIEEFQEWYNENK